MSTYVVSGSASGIGAAVTTRLRTDGHTVIGVDLRDAEVIGDLSTASGRDAAAAAVGVLTDRVDGVVPCAGVAGLTATDPQLVVSLNFFGAIALVKALQPLTGEGSSVVLISSDSATCQPVDHRRTDHDRVVLENGRCRVPWTSNVSTPRSTYAPAACSGANAPATAPSGTTATRRSTSVRTVRRTCPRWPA
jgi:NAD(P)-dependent dehydrogenase (short-subunit alcohol dehydrogenase family)